MGADGATSREGAAESRRLRGGGGCRAAGHEVHIVSTYLPLTCHKVFSTSGNFVSVNRARGLRRIYIK